MLLVAGVLLGVALTLGVGAADKNPAAPTPPKKDWSRMSVVSYPMGTTGFFDPDSGRLYIYDLNLVNCVMIREFTALGQPMKQILN